MKLKLVICSLIIACLALILNEKTSPFSRLPVTIADVAFVRNLESESETATPVLAKRILNFVFEKKHVAVSVKCSGYLLLLRDSETDEIELYCDQTSENRKKIFLGKVTHQEIDASSFKEYFYVKFVKTADMQKVSSRSYQISI